MTSKHEAAVLLGKLGGKALAQKLTPDERAAVARKAAATRKRTLTPEQRREIAMMGVKARLAKRKAKTGKKGR